MTLAAKGVELIGSELPGVARADFRRVLDVARGGTVTALAANPQFVRSDYLVRGDRKWSRRMTTEAAQDSSFGIEDAVLNAAGVFVARRAANPVELPVPGFVLFDIRVGIQPADESDGLYAGAKRPEPRLRRFGRCQSPRVRTRRLRGKFGGMTFGACRGPGVIGRRHAEERLTRQENQP